MYADRNGLPEDLSSAFVEIIREMDAGYLKWAAEEEKSKRRPSGV
jgi:hypothetical protein